MKKLITIKEIADDKKRENKVAFIEIAVLLVAIIAFGAFLIWSGTGIWGILGISLIGVLFLVIVILTLINYSSDKKVFNGNNYFIVKSKCIGTDSYVSDVSDNGTTYKTYILKFPKYGEYSVQEGVGDCSVYHNDYIDFYLLVSKNKSYCIHNVFPVDEWEIDEKDFVLKNKIYYPNK